MKENGKGERLWTPNDKEGFARVKGLDGGLLEPHVALVSAIDEHNGSFSLDGEAFTFDDSEGKVWRRKF